MLILFHSVFDNGKLEYKSRVQNLALLAYNSVEFYSSHLKFVLCSIFCTMYTVLVHNISTRTCWIVDLHNTIKYWSQLGWVYSTFVIYQSFMNGELNTVEMSFLRHYFMWKKVVWQKCSSGNTGINWPNKNNQQYSVFPEYCENCSFQPIYFRASKTIHRHIFLKRPLILNSGRIVLSAEVLLKVRVTIL